MTTAIHVIPMTRTAALTVMLLTVPALSMPAQAEEACLIGTEAPDFGDPVGEAMADMGDPSAHTGLHGQGVYGADAVYLNHLAVFMGNPNSHPHNFQVLLEVSFDDPGAAAAYRNDWLANQHALYTAKPPVFDQLALVAEDARLRSLPVTEIYRGHFEKTGRELITEADLTVDNVLYLREFNLDGDKLPTQSYLLYGRGDDVYLTHVLSVPADFDQTLAVTVTPMDVPTATIRELLDGFVASGVFLELPERINEEASRLRPGDTIVCHFSTPTRAQPVMVELSVEAEPYCESGEVEAVVMDRFNDPRPCPE